MDERETPVTESQIWETIVNDTPREWIVSLDGTYFAREYSTAARLASDVHSWLVESMIWGMEYGARKARFSARCETTDERVLGDVAAFVTPEMGASTMA